MSLIGAPALNNLPLNLANKLSGSQLFPFALTFKTPASLCVITENKLLRLVLSLLGYLAQNNRPETFPELQEQKELLSFPTVLLAKGSPGLYTHMHTQ